MIATNYVPTATHISLTDEALMHFTTSLAGQTNKWVRLSVKASGCSGHASILDIADKTKPDDLILKASKAVTLAIAADTLVILNGTEIDISAEINRVAQFNNPI